MSRGDVISADPVGGWVPGRFHYDGINESVGHNQSAFAGDDLFANYSQFAGGINRFSVIAGPTIRLDADGVSGAVEGGTFGDFREGTQRAVGSVGRLLVLDNRGLRDD